MNRRNAIRNLVLTSGTLITLPVWMGCADNNVPLTHRSSFSTTEQKTLATIADTIIPAGNAIGALATGVDKYLQKLFDDCHPKEEQDNIKMQLKALEAYAMKEQGRSFEDCTQQQREEFLLKWSASEAKEEKDFFTLIKSETIRGFNTSQQVMQHYLDYKVAPGHYYGCVAIKA
jgi:hypothetical protein